MGKKASHAGQECISSKEMVLRSEDTLEEDPDERERFELCETWKNSKLEMLCFLRKKNVYIVVVIKWVFCYLIQSSFQ